MQRFDHEMGSILSTFIGEYISNQNPYFTIPKITGLTTIFFKKLNFLLFFLQYFLNGERISIQNLAESAGSKFFLSPCSRQTTVWTSITRLIRVCFTRFFDPVSDSYAFKITVVPRCKTSFIENTQDGSWHFLSPAGRKRYILFVIRVLSADCASHASTYTESQH